VEEREVIPGVGNNRPPAYLFAPALFVLLALLTESLEVKLSLVLHSKRQKSLGSTENGNCSVQVVASKS